MGIGARLKRSAQSEQAARVGRSAQETTRHAHHVRAESAAHAGFAQRRGLLGNAAALAFAPTLSALAWAGAPAAAPPRLLILLELRGGNDGLNTVVPVDDGSYYDLRPHLALRGDGVVRFAPDLALHSALAPWRTLWDAGEMAVIQGVGYPAPNLSHFRSIEIWDTAADSDQYLPSGWLTRASRGNAAFQACSADGAIIGAADPGPLGGGARAVALQDPERFARQARMTTAEDHVARGALAHVIAVENEIVRAGIALHTELVLHTEFPRGGFGAALHAAALVAATRRVPVIRVTLAGFDTHQNQIARQAQLLDELALGVVALRAASIEVGVWRDTLLVTYSEFGRRPRENGSGGTDHGTAGPMFAFGPKIAGGLYGEPPALARLDTSGNLAAAVDFRSVYSSILQNWWEIDSAAVLGRRFAPVPFLRSAAAPA